MKAGAGTSLAHAPTGGLSRHRRRCRLTAAAQVDALLDKVEKLLALSTSSNVHEAAQAAARAQALIEAHRLEAALADRRAAGAQVAALEVEVLEVARRPRAWRGVLAAGLARLHCCLCFTAEVDREVELRLVGLAADRAAVRALFGWLAPRLEWLSATHGPGRDRDWHDAFRIGAVDTILTRMGAAEHEAPVHAEGALVLRAEQDRRAAAVEAWATAHLRAGRGRGLRVDRGGHAAGRAAATALTLPAAGAPAPRRRPR